jgi:hypothetical protein
MIHYNLIKREDDMYMKKSLAVLSVIAFLGSDASGMRQDELKSSIVQVGSKCGLSLGEDEKANAAQFDRYFKERHGDVIAFLEQAHDTIDTTAAADAIFTQLSSIRAEFESKLPEDERFLLWQVSFEFGPTNKLSKAARIVQWIRELPGPGPVTDLSGDWETKAHCVLRCLQCGMFAGNGQAVADFIRESEEYLLGAIPEMAAGNWCGLWAGPEKDSLSILHVGDWVYGTRLENLALFVDGNNKSAIDELLQKVRQAVIRRLSQPDAKAEIKRLHEISEKGFGK